MLSVLCGWQQLVEAPFTCGHEHNCSSKPTSYTYVMLQFSISPSVFRKSLYVNYSPLFFLANRFSNDHEKVASECMCFVLSRVTCQVAFSNLRRHRSHAVLSSSVLLFCTSLGIIAQFAMCASGCPTAFSTICFAAQEKTTCLQFLHRFGPSECEWMC